MPRSAHLGAASPGATGRGTSGPRSRRAPRRSPAAARPAHRRVMTDGGDLGHGLRKRCTPNCAAGTSTTIRPPPPPSTAARPRSATHAENRPRPPPTNVMRQAAISSGRSSPSRRSPNVPIALASSQRSFSTVTGAASCWARYCSTSSARVSAVPNPTPRRSFLSERSRPRAHPVRWRTPTLHKP